MLTEQSTVAAQTTELHESSTKNAKILCSKHIKKTSTEEKTDERDKTTDYKMKEEGKKILATETSNLPKKKETISPSSKNFGRNF